MAGFFRSVQPSGQGLLVDRIDAEKFACGTKLTAISTITCTSSIKISAATSWA